MSGWFGFNEFELRIGMTQLSHLRVKQRVIFRVVHQPDVVFELGRESNGQNIFCERNRMRFEQITSGEWTGATDRFNESSPERFQIT